MGFNCIVCNQREIWDFETTPDVCLDCFMKKDDWTEQFKSIPNSLKYHHIYYFKMNAYSDKSCEKACKKLGIEPYYLENSSNLSINKGV